MYSKFLKTFLFISTSTLMVFTSCSDEKDTNEEVLDPSTILETTLSEEAFNNLAKQIKTDPTVINYTIIDPNNSDSIQTTNGLKRSESRDKVNPYDELVNIKPNKYYLHGIYGKYSSSVQHAKLSDSRLSNRIIDVDLNRNAGGDYVYLYTNWEQDGWGSDTWTSIEYAITGLVASSNKSYINSVCSDYVRLNSTYGTEWLDCNHKTKKGGPIYLGIRRKKDYGGNPIKGIMVVAYNSPKNDYVAGGYYKETNVGDLNAGCGKKSDYIYIFTKK